MSHHLRRRTGSPAPARRVGPLGTAPRLSNARCSPILHVPRSPDEYLPVFRRRANFSKASVSG